MEDGTKIALRLFGGAALIVAVALGSMTTGYRIGVGRSFTRDKRFAESPAVEPETPAPWQGEAHPPHPPVPDVAFVPGRAGDVPASTAPGAEVPFALDMTKPVRLSWPLEVGPDWGPDRPDDRICLRAREGANELQQPGTGKALYPFRIARAGRYMTYCRVRWPNDGVGSVECNNSWFAGFDGAAAQVVGNEEWHSKWFWEIGPTAELSAGIHWLRVELREDGPVTDRIVFFPARRGPAGATVPLEDVKIAGRSVMGSFAGLAPPLDPQSPLRRTELWAVPTGSLAIGKGHLNEITLGASWLGGDAGDFNGRVGVSCPTASGLKLRGDPEVSVSAEVPHARNVIGLEFPAGTARRSHKVIVTVTDTRSGSVVFREEMRFTRPAVWAFMGPFADTSAGNKSLYRGEGSVRKLKHACDKNPLLLAHMKPPAELGLAEAPLVRGHKGKLGWRIVDDGSCCDWTGAVDLRRVYGRTGPAFCYAVTWLSAETRLHHRSFSFQVDDSGWLWINGDFVVALPVDLPREANRLWTSCRLNRGPNPVVVKLTQNQRYWGFRLDVVDWHWQGRRGDVITATEPAKWPKK